MKLNNAFLRPCIFLLSIFMFVFNGEISAIRMKQLTIEQLTNLSSVIITGKIVDIRSYWNSDNSTILTDVDIEVENILKGEIHQKIITVQLLGGKVNNITTAVVGGPNFTMSEEVALFLKSDLKTLSKIEDRKFHIVALSQGKFNIRWDKTKSQKIASSEAINEELLPGSEGGNLPPGGNTGMLLKEFVSKIKSINLNNN